MRLWHYKLIPVLPNAMLVSQWRECIAIKRQWEKGTLKHRLVLYVKNHDELYFIQYVSRITYELRRRNIKFNNKLYDEIFDFYNENTIEGNILTVKLVFNYPEHNDRYLKQCYYNLQEKFDRGIITKEEWEKIEGVIDENN